MPHEVFEIGQREPLHFTFFFRAIDLVEPSPGAEAACPQVRAAPHLIPRRCGPARAPPPHASLSTRSVARQPLTAFAARPQVMKAARHLLRDTLIVGTEQEAIAYSLACGDRRHVPVRGRSSTSAPSRGRGSLHARFLRS